MRETMTLPLDAANKENIAADGLNAGSYMAETLGVEGQDIKPCIALYFRDGCLKGLTPIGRNDACHLLAVELRRLGFGNPELLPHLREWNDKNTPPMQDIEIKRIIESAFRKCYRYGCQNSKITFTCIGKEHCPFIKSGKGKYKKTVLWRNFVLNGWQWQISHTANMIYNIALPEVEYRRQISAGGRLYVNHREIASILGLKSHSRIGQYLKELNNFRLINYIPGNSLKKKRTASEIIRIVPIPEVPELLNE